MGSCWSSLARTLLMCFRVLHEQRINEDLSLSLNIITISIAYFIETSVESSKNSWLGLVVMTSSWSPLASRCPSFSGSNAVDARPGDYRTATGLKCPAHIGPNHARTSEHVCTSSEMWVADLFCILIGRTEFAYLEGLLGKTLPKKRATGAGRDRRTWREAEMPSSKGDGLKTLLARRESLDATALLNEHEKEKGSLVPHGGWSIATDIR
ncbi:unnamed protein product [Protopolystoma xenopodis]|uniref:Uncharacterized protein n=1 Tax=Protopolystoma xenopodis TaxID=117903 RepID=A0A448XB61_9PLAT|nr:unnamed protein product [Protopolystoma xenopodis]